MLYESNLLTLETIRYSLGYIVLSIVLWAQEVVLTHVIVDWDRFMQVLYKYCIWVELPVQRRLCPIFVKIVGSPNIHEYSAG